MVVVFQDYYEGTDYDMRKTITVTDKGGETVISPLANPFMPYDELKMLKINGGWGELGERTIGHQDAGATSCFFILQSLARACE